MDQGCVNAVTSNDPYQMLKVDDLIDKVGNTTYLAKFDPTKGYYKVPVAEKDHDKNALITPFGKFQCVTMPFGVKEASTTFQQLMNHLLKAIQNHCLAYLDDIIEFSSTWETTLNTSVIHLSYSKDRPDPFCTQVSVWNSEMRLSWPHNWAR